jgi:hypothetical protein
MELLPCVDDVGCCSVCQKCLVHHTSAQHWTATCQQQAATISYLLQAPSHSPLPLLPTHVLQHAMSA